MNKEPQTGGTIQRGSTAAQDFLKEGHRIPGLLPSQPATEVFQPPSGLNEAEVTHRVYPRKRSLRNRRGAESRTVSGQPAAGTEPE